VFSIWWLGEHLAWYHVVGIAAIFAGLILLGRLGRERKAIS
jgi:drug/metabolite transporter (DMT)-like permease